MSDVLNNAGFEEIVRNRAYALWENEGRPSGRDAEHWLTSEQEARREMVSAPAEAPVAKAKPASRKKSGAKRAA